MRNKAKLIIAAKKAIEFINNIMIERSAKKDQK